MASSIKPKTAAGTVAAVAFAIVMHFTPTHEGREYKPYLDVGNVWTACEGITGGIDPNHIYTDAECDQLKAQRIRRAEAAVDRHVKVEMTANRRAALIDWTFNLGEGSLARSSMLKKLNAGDVVGACRAILDWMYVGGKDCREKKNKCGGIVTRRQWQHDMCMKPDEHWWKYLWSA